MTTKIYGCSDDLVEFEGEVRGEVSSYDSKSFVACSDGTLLEVEYGKPQGGIWKVTLIRKGDLFDRIDICESEDADPYSDVAYFKPGLKWAMAGRSFERVS